MCRRDRAFDSGACASRAGLAEAGIERQKEREAELVAAIDNTCRAPATEDFRSLIA